MSSRDRPSSPPNLGAYPHTNDSVEVRQLFHELCSQAIENLNEQFKGIFDTHGQMLIRAWSTLAAGPWTPYLPINSACGIAMSTDWIFLSA